MNVKATAFGFGIGIVAGFASIWILYKASKPVLAAFLAHEIAVQGAQNPEAVALLGETGSRVLFTVVGTAAAIAVKEKLP